MRVIFFGNNRLGLQTLNWLRAYGEDLVGLVVHPRDRSDYADKLIEASGLPEERVFLGNTLRDADSIERLTAMKPDIGLSVLFGYILSPEVIGLFNMGCINLHLSFLPYNKGAFPNVWSIVDGTPAGVTLHYIDEGVDTGDIISQKEVVVEAWDTGESLYRKLEQEAFQLFVDSWSSIRSGSAARFPQVPNTGTVHRLRDVKELDRIELDESYSARHLINVLRARTFAGYRGAYFQVGDQRIFLQLKLEVENM